MQKTKRKKSISLSLMFWEEFFAVLQRDFITVGKPRISQEAAWFAMTVISIASKSYELL
jgi:hypothetical protein